VKVMVVVVVVTIVGRDVSRVLDVMLDNQLS
jgi:hypothetical protein